MRRIWPHLLLLTAVTFGYGSSLGNGLVWDDILYIRDAPSVREARFGEIATRPIGSYYRPVVFASYALEARFAGDAPALFHASNLLLHTLAASLLHAAALALGAGRGAALAGALLFALHPVQSEAVFYVSGRTDVLAAVFALACLRLHARGAGWKARATSWRARAAAVLSFALALGCKESVVALPGALALGDRMLARDEARGPKAILLSVLPYALVLALYALGRGGLAGEGLSLAPTEVGTRWAAAAAAVADYARLLLLPIGLHLERFATADPWRVAAGLACLACVTGAALRARAAIRVWLVFAACAYLPIANLIPVYPGLPANQVFAPEHFLYLPSAGLFAAFTLALAPRVGLRLGVAGLVALLLAYGAILNDRARDWRDEQTLYTHTLEHSPTSARVRLNIGNVYLESGETVRALEHFDAGLEWHPRDPDLLTNAGIAAMRLGRLPEAERALRRAVELEPERSQAWSNLGALLGSSGRLGEAERAYAHALELDPANSDAAAGLRLLDALAPPPGSFRSSTER